MKIENLTVDEFTTPSPMTVRMYSSLAEVVTIMKEHNIRHLPVVDDKDKPIGIITQRDINMLKGLVNLTHSKVETFMHQNIQTVDFRTLLSEAVYIMSEKKIGSLIVTGENGNLYGIFTNTDALNALVETLRGEVLTSSL